MSSLEQWLFVVPSWVVYLVAFALPCAEAAIFAGIVVPGESGLLIAGALAGLGHVHPAGVAACGVAGAVIGDSIGFEVGRYLGPRLRTSRLGRVVKPAHWRRAERFMGRYGAHAVFLGRWVSFGRALIPAIAGATGMRYRDFFAWNVLGGVTWGLAVTALGYIAGGSWRLVSDALGPGALLVVLTLAVVAAVVGFARWIARNPERVRAWSRRQADRPSVRYVRERYDRQVRWLGRRFAPRAVLGLGLTVGVVLIVAIGWLFGSVVEDVIAGEEAVRGDLPVLRWLVDHRAPALTSVVTAAYHVTGVWAALALAAVVALAGRGWRGRTVLMASAWAGALGCALLVEALVGRIVPPAQHALLTPTGPGSFPALGVTVATAVAAVAAFVTGARARTWARSVAYWTAAVLWTAAAGTSAVYLGAAWTTDVLGGRALGALWAALLVTAWTTRSRLRAANGAAGAAPS